jgi:cytochrome P450
VSDGKSRLVPVTLGESPYVDALLLEDMRLKQPLLLPRLAVCDTSVADFRVSRGSIVYANNYALTHSEALWQNPRDFRSSRFMKREVAMHPGSFSSGPPAHVGGEGVCPFIDVAAAPTASGASTPPKSPSGSVPDLHNLIPFSVGQRSCPGKEKLAYSQMRILMSTLLRQLTWASPLPWLAGVDLSESYSLTLTPSASQPLRFRRRHTVGS